MAAPPTVSAPPPVANANVNASLPVIGDIHGVPSFAAVTRGHKRRKIIGDQMAVGQCTQTEYGQAIVYEQQVVSAVAPPTWAAQMQRQLQRQLDRMEALIRNIEARRTNSFAVTMGGNTGLVPLQKVVAGHFVVPGGLGPAAAAAWAASAAAVYPGAAPPAHAIGTLPAAVPAVYFPGTAALISTLTEEQLRRLQVLYNEDFGIAPGMALHDQVDLFRRWCVGQPKVAIALGLTTLSPLL